MRAMVDRAKGPTRFALVLSGAAAHFRVRMALGAQRGNIFQLVIGQGMRLSVVGILVGAAGALALTPVMSTMLVGVSPTDPVTFGSIGLVFVAIAAVACWLPARRAAGLDPTVALRED